MQPQRRTGRTLASAPALAPALDDFLRDLSAAGIKDKAGRSDKMIILASGQTKKRVSALYLRSLLVLVSTTFVLK